MRAYTRPASTPWIVFDRDSKIDVSMGGSPPDPYSQAAVAALRAGVAFMSSPDLPPTTPAVPAALAYVPPPAPVVAPAPAPAPAAPIATVASMHAPRGANDVEPSSLIVAKDVVEDRASLPVIYPAPKRGGLKLAIAAAAFMGIAAGGTLAFTSAVDAPAPAAAAVQAPPPAQVIVAQPAPEPVAAPAPAAAAPVGPAEVVGENATDPKKRWGNLTIKPDAKTRTVWFDGKRMLGSGNRSFMVYCGMHTIAINEKTNQKDMEVPCNGDLTIGGK